MVAIVVVVVFGALVVLAVVVVFGRSKTSLLTGRVGLIFKSFLQIMLIVARIVNELLKDFFLQAILHADTKTIHHQNFE